MYYLLIQEEIISLTLWNREIAEYNQFHLKLPGRNILFGVELERRLQWVAAGLCPP